MWSIFWLRPQKTKRPLCCEFKSSPTTSTHSTHPARSLASAHLFFKQPPNTNNKSRHCDSPLYVFRAHSSDRMGVTSWFFFFSLAVNLVRLVSCLRCCYSLPLQRHSRFVRTRWMCASEWDTLRSQSYLISHTFRICKVQIPMWRWYICN